MHGRRDVLQGRRQRELARSAKGAADVRSRWVAVLILHVVRWIARVEEKLQALRSGPELLLTRGQFGSDFAGGQDCVYVDGYGVFQTAGVTSGQGAGDGDFAMAGGFEDAAVALH